MPPLWRHLAQRWGDHGDVAVGRLGLPAHDEGLGFLLFRKTQMEKGWWKPKAQHRLEEAFPGSTFGKKI